jgi:hypothetical protein
MLCRDVAVNRLVSSHLLLIALCTLVMSCWRCVMRPAFCRARQLVNSLLLGYYATVEIGPACGHGNAGYVLLFLSN